VSHWGVEVVNHWRMWRRVGLMSMLGLELIITARVMLGNIGFDKATTIWSMVLKLMPGLPTTLNEALRAVVVGLTFPDANFIGIGGRTGLMHQGAAHQWMVEMVEVHGQKEGVHALDLLDL